MSTPGWILSGIFLIFVSYLIWLRKQKKGTSQGTGVASEPKKDEKDIRQGDVTN